jgi:hypothetical protein
MAKSQGSFQKAQVIGWETLDLDSPFSLLMKKEGQGEKSRKETRITSTKEANALVDTNQEDLTSNGNLHDNLQLPLLDLCFRCFIHTL